MSKHVIPGFQLASQIDGLADPTDFRLLRRLPRVDEIETQAEACRPVRLGIIDTETTGLDTHASEVVELASTIMTINVDGRLHRIEEPVCWRSSLRFRLSRELFRSPDSQTRISLIKGSTITRSRVFSIAVMCSSRTMPDLTGLSSPSGLMAW